MSTVPARPGNGVVPDDVIDTLKEVMELRCYKDPKSNMYRYINDHGFEPCDHLLGGACLNIPIKLKVIPYGWGSTVTICDACGRIVRREHCSDL